MSPNCSRSLRYSVRGLRRIRRRLSQSATPHGPGAHGRGWRLGMAIPFCRLVGPEGPEAPRLDPVWCALSWVVSLSPACPPRQTGSICPVLCHCVLLHTASHGTTLGETSPGLHAHTAYRASRGRGVWNSTVHQSAREGRSVSA